MNWISAYFSRNYFRYFFSIKKVINPLLVVFGALWLCVEIISYFSDGIGNLIKGHWFLFIVVGLLWTLWENRPILSTSQHLSGRDINIELCIGDFFDFKGSYIIGSNTTFDTEMRNGLISEKSLQGQFTNKYYDNLMHLDNELEGALKSESFSETNSNKIGKKKCYEIGTVAKLAPRNSEAYFVAIAELNEHGIASSSFDNIKDSLVKLWDFIANRGGIEPLVIPVIGSGFSRIEIPRELIIKEIVKSFIAACATKRFAEKLIIVIYPNDYKKYDINLMELNEFIKYQCKYTEFKDNNELGRGIGISS